MRNVIRRDLAGRGADLIIVDDPLMPAGLIRNRPASECSTGTVGPWSHVSMGDWIETLNEANATTTPFWRSQFRRLSTQSMP
jgi:hypothetical protein